MAGVEYCPTLLEGQCGVHGHCRISETLPYLTIQKMPNVLYGRPREDWDVFSFQKLYAYSGNIRPSIVLLDCRDVTEVSEWHIRAFSMTMARSLMTCGICSISTSDKSWHFGVTCYCPKYKECPYNGHALLITPVHTTPVWWEQYLIQGVPQLCAWYMCYIPCIDGFPALLVVSVWYSGPLWDVAWCQLPWHARGCVSGKNLSELGCDSIA